MEATCQCGVELPPAVDRHAQPHHRGPARLEAESAPRPPEPERIRTIRPEGAPGDPLLVPEQVQERNGAHEQVAVLVEDHILGCALLQNFQWRPPPATTGPCERPSEEAEGKGCPFAGAGPRLDDVAGPVTEQGARP